jgi:hypothetical protein
MEIAVLLSSVFAAMDAAGDGKAQLSINQGMRTPPRRHGFSVLVAMISGPERAHEPIANAASRVSTRSGIEAADNRMSACFLPHSQSTGALSWINRRCWRAQRLAEHFVFQTGSSLDSSQLFDLSNLSLCVTRAGIPFARKCPGTQWFTETIRSFSFLPAA